MKKGIIPIILVTGIIFSLYALTLGSMEFTLSEVINALKGQGDETIKGYKTSKNNNGFACRYDARI